MFLSVIDWNLAIRFALPVDLVTIFAVPEHLATLDFQRVIGLGISKQDPFGLELLFNLGGSDPGTHPLHDVPINKPARKTSVPPMTTCTVALNHGVSM